MCGRGIMGSRFCSQRCREACDAGFPRPDPHYDRKVAASKLEGWRVVAGPGVGSIYYKPFLEAVAARPSARKRRKVLMGHRSKSQISFKKPRVFNGLQRHLCGPSIGGKYLMFGQSRLKIWVRRASQAAPTL